MVELGLKDGGGDWKIKKWRKRVKAFWARGEAKRVWCSTSKRYAASWDRVRLV